MRKSVVFSCTAIILAVATATSYATDQPATVTEKPGKPAAPQASIMDQPVDFTTPEKVQKSLQAVRAQAGDAAARDLKNALQYILTYDLSIGRDQAKLYKKLNGRTPRQIIAKMKRQP
jgi:hypothetical protein